LQVGDFGGLAKPKPLSGGASAPPAAWRHTDLPLKLPLSLNLAAAWTHSANLILRKPLQIMILRNLSICPIWPGRKSKRENFEFERSVQSIRKNIM
jgi:hypothetical protein